MGSGDDSGIWFAVRVAPQQRPCRGGKFSADPANAPFALERLMQRRGFDTFMPRRTVFRFSNGATAARRRKREVPQPLLVGWIFVSWTTGENRWRELFDLPGVIGVAGVDGRPAPIRGAKMMEFVDRLKGVRLTAHERERFMRSGAEYEPGQTVRMLSAPFEGFTGRVVSVQKRRARILLALFGRPVEIEIDAALLEAAE